MGPIAKVLAHVDRRGGVAPVEGNWTLHWWVGADDRWHLAGKEAAVRQHLIEDTPVVETRMRVPGGDAVNRVYGATGAGARPAVVIEVVNESRLPFAIAFVVVTEAGRIDLAGRRVTIDGSPALDLPTTPHRAAAVPAGEDSLTATVCSGGAGASFPSGDHGAAAFLFPMAHSSAMRVVLPGGPNARTLPSARQVAAGWQAHVAAGLRMILPDASMAASVQANRCLLLMRHGLAAAMILDHYGHHHLAAERIRAAWGDQGSALSPPIIAALAEHWRLTRDTDLLVGLAPFLAAAGEKAVRAGHLPALLIDIADLLTAVDEPEAARAAARYAGRAAVRPADDGLLSTVRSELMQENPGGLALLPDLPAAWRGGAVELHDAPTRFGALSFALRWHGDRPALLWELRPHAGLPVIRFTAPILGASWQSTALAGEALFS